MLAFVFPNNWPTVQDLARELRFFLQ